MKILYFDCFAGISGDMTLGAFLDLGVDFEYLKTELDKLGLEGLFHLEIEKTQKMGISGTKCHVILEKHEHEHRHFSDIKKIIEDSTLEEEVKQTAIAIFTRVAKAEGKVHGVDMNHVHFHEVGAIDSIVDIVGSAICFHAMKVDKVYTSAVNVGQGYVKCAHGIIAVPAPATVEIAADKKLPIYSEHLDKEAVTPTGMAIVCELAQYSRQMPLMAVEKVGYGFGSYEFKVVNGLRLMIGEEVS